MDYHTGTGQVALPIVLISLIFLPHEIGNDDALPHRAPPGSAACFFFVIQRASRPLLFDVPAAFSMHAMAQINRPKPVCFCSVC